MKKAIHGSYLTLLLIVLFCVCQDCHALSLSQPKTKHASPQAPQASSSSSPLQNMNNHNQSSSNTNRRSFLSLSLPSLLILSSITTTTTFPSNANALKPKNDALCGTGFFEHIYEYKCTAIGDIEDEGKTKEMNSNEMGLTDGLMGKLNLSSSSSSLVDESEESSKLNSNNDAMPMGVSTKENTQRKR